MNDLKKRLLELPEVQVLKGVVQGKTHHPEGDVYIHTCMVMDKLPDDASEALVWAAALHDTGKALTQVIYNEYKVTFYGHECVSSKIARDVLVREGRSDIVELVCNLVYHHMRPHQAHTFGKKGMRKTLAMPFLNELLILAEADTRGRGINRNPGLDGIKAIERAIEKEKENE